MNPQRVREICKERLDIWIEKMISEHATPVILVGVGHDHNSGRVIVHTCQDFTDEDIVLFLMGVLRMAQDGKIKR